MKTRNELEENTLEAVKKTVEDTNFIVLIKSPFLFFKFIRY